MHENFPISLQLRIDWSELDYFGHVNNVMFFKYVQAARVNYWDAIGLNDFHIKTNIGPILASTSCRFLKTLFYPGNIEIKSSVHFIKTTSFGIKHYILNDKGEVAAEAEDVIVMLDYNTRLKTEIPDTIRKAIEQIENR